MPPLCIHLRIAQDAVARLGSPLLREHLGACLFGATAPDIRGPLGWPRERTHFTRLEEIGAVDNLERMFEALPHLADARRLPPPVAAFVAGYCSHLVTDDLWVLEVYRRYFGEDSPLARSPLALVWDRALQFELDNRQREDPNAVALWQARLAEVEPDLELGFLEPPALERWLGIVLETTARELSWERFRSLAERVLIPGRGLSAEAVEQFLASLPESLEELHRHVAWEVVERFQRKAIEQTVETMERYLS